MRSNTPSDSDLVQLEPTPIVAELPFEDSQLLAEIEQRSPQAKTLYAENFRKVNTYIDDAKRALELEPADEDSAQHLREAYVQKAMLYQKATSRSLE